MANEWFLDTSFAIALSVVNDEHHTAALTLAELIEQRHIPLVTTRGVCLEIGNALSKLRYRPAAVALLESLENDPNIEIVPLTEERYAKTMALFRARLDKEWGLVDCLSFVVMQERMIHEALTADEHFRQSGFRPLLKEPPL